MDFDQAIQTIRDNGISVTRQAYGFSLSVHDAVGHFTAECGREHGGGVSLATRHKGLPVVWFFGAVPSEIAALLVTAHRLLLAGQQTDWISALKAVDPSA